MFSLNTQQALEEKFPKDASVIFIPMHAYGDINHPDCKYGRVKSCNGTFVFVRFGVGDTATACSPEQLRLN